MVAFTRSSYEISKSIVLRKVLGLIAAKWRLEDEEGYKQVQWDGVGAFGFS